MLRATTALGSLASFVFALTFGTVYAQQPVTSPAPFRKPLIFTPPQMPGVAFANRGELKYQIDVTVAKDGTVSAISSIEPDDPEFREQVERVIKFWLFFPALDPATCEAVPGAARVGVDFTAGGDNGTRVWLQYDPMLRLMSGKQPQVIHKPAAPSYPREEARRGVQGDLYVVSNVDAVGKVVKTWVLLDKAYSSGLVRTAQEHARGFVYDAGQRDVRCSVTIYEYRLK